MDEQAGRSRAATEPDGVEVLDLPPDPSSGDGSPRTGWLGRAALGVVAVALLAGGVALARQADEPGSGGPDGDLVPLAIGDGGSGEVAADAAAMLWAGEEYELAADLPDLGSAAPVHRLVRPERRDEAWAALAEDLGVVGGSVAHRPDGGVVVSDGATHVEAYPMAGAWSVSVGHAVAVPVAIDRLALPGSPAPEAPIAAEGLGSTTEAEARARGLLERAGVLVGADWEVEVVEGMVGYAACAVPADGSGVGCAEDPPPTVTSWSVLFHRVVDGVVTAGLDWAVEVGAGGEVHVVSGILTDLEPLGDYSLRSTRAAYDELVARSAAVSGPGAGIEPGVVTGPADDVVVDAGATVEPCLDTACIDPGPLVDPMPIDPVLVDPLPPVEPLVVTVTGVERTATVTWGSSEGAEVAYLVPSYRFVGTYPDGARWWTEVVAVADELVVPVGPIDPPTEPPVTEVPVTDVPATVPVTEVPATEVPGTEPPSPPATDEVPACSNEHPEACAGSIPTTAPPATVPCTPVTTPNGATLPPGPECTASEPVID